MAKHNMLLCTHAAAAKAWLSSSLALLALLVPATSALAQARLFEVVAPDKVAFNWPDPPREGAPEYFTIAENGKALCVIVQPAEPSRLVLRAVAGLRTYLQLVTGARFRVIRDSVAAPAGMAAIHVGDTAVAVKVKLGLPDVRYGKDAFPNLNGYLVETLDPHTLVIRGRTDKATMHGVVGFLERYAGVREYWLSPPGGLGDVIPSRPTLRLPKIEWRDWPYFFSRSMSMHGFGRGYQPLDFFRRQRTLPCNENYARWLPQKKFAKTHPEYFSLVNGKRRAGGKSGWQPCVSNPNVVRVMADGVIAYFRQNPDALAINFAINDGGGDCMCNACRAMDAPGVPYPGGLSDRYVRFTNEVCDIVGREFPSKSLVYLAYASARAAPKSVKPDATLLAVLTTPGNAFAAWDGWMASGARRMGLYVHHDDDGFFLLPKLDIHQSARRIRYAVASGRARVFYMEAHPRWPLSGPVSYLAAKLTWDPRQEVDKLLDGFYADFFGPAAGPMKTFYGTLEAGYERWLQERGGPHWFGKDISSIRGGRSVEQFRVLTPGEAARASAALAQAAAAAAGNERAAERIKVIGPMFRLDELAARHYWTAERLKTRPVKSEADAQRMVADARRLSALSREMSDYIHNTLEKPPVDAYALFKRSRKGRIYQTFKSGKPGPEVGFAIAAGVGAAAEFLRENLGPEKAAAWWRSLRQTEKEPVLRGAFESAELRASGVEVKNLLKDPSFERVGKELAPDETAVDTDIVLDRARQGRLGIRQWFPERSPYRIVLTRKEAHSGLYSLMFERCYRTRLDAGYTRAKPGERYRAGLWFQRNEGHGAYSAVVDAKLKDGTYPRLASFRIPNKPGQWQKIGVDVAAPPKAKLIILRVFVGRQAADARCWIDDLFVGRYPD